MPIYLAPDEEYPYVTPRSSESRAREIATLLDQHGVPHDAPTLLALVRVTWMKAVEFAIEGRRE